MEKYITSKKKMKFQSVEALQQVKNVINEASEALKNPKRIMLESPIPEVLAGALGMVGGGVGSFAALYGLGTVGLSAVGITSGLATAGAGVSALVGGAVSPMVAGVFVIGAPIAILPLGGVLLAGHLKNVQLRQEKERLYQEALEKHNAIIKALQTELDATKERLEYLQSLNILLAAALKDLRHDLGYATP